MAYFKKNDVLNSITSRTMTVRGRQYTIFEAYLGTSPVSKKPVRKSASSKDKLAKIVNDFYKQLGSGGEAAILLTAYQSMDAKTALDLLAAAGLDLSLTECARRVIDNSDGLKPCTTTLADAYAAYEKRQEGKSVEHRKAVVKRVKRFVETFGGDRLVSDVTAKTLAEYLAREFYETPSESAKTTYNNHLNYIKTFVAWCAAPEQGYVKENAVASVKPLTKSYVDPEYMKAADVEKLFRVLEKRGGADLADAILSFWCGMRQEEIKRVAEGEEAVVIDLDEKYIRVIKCKGHLRGIKPRAFNIPEQALAWMKSMPDFVATARTQNTYFRDRLVDAAKEAGVKLPDNAGRHTFCTMFEAAHHDSNALSAIVGNTESIRDRHYNGVAKPQEGRDYFAIMPSKGAV